MRVYKENKSSLYPFLFYMIVYFSINVSISGDINDARIWFLFISFLSQSGRYTIFRPQSSNIEIPISVIGSDTNTFKI